MRLVLFVLSLTFSACLFVWKTDSLGDFVQSGSLQDTSNLGTGQAKDFTDQLMAQAMAMMVSPDAAGLASGSMAISSPGMAGMPDTKALQSQIESQIAGSGMGATKPTVTRPKDFSARFVKARGTE